MSTILQLNTSLFGESGQSSRLAGDFSSALAGATGAGVVVRDLARRPVPHLTAERFAAFGAPVAERTLEQQRHVAESDALIEELRLADVLVLAVPMYNIGIPSTLKAYFDHAGTPADLQTAYLKQFLGFLGIHDVEFIYAEGLSLGPEQRKQALAAAIARIDQLAA